MIKLNKFTQKAIYQTSPYFTHIALQGALVKSVHWDGNTGIMALEKERQDYKLVLSQKAYDGRDNLKAATQHCQGKIIRRVTATLSKVKAGDIGLGFVYNLKQINV